MTTKVFSVYDRKSLAYGPLVVADTRGIAIRKLNPLNPRALKRGLRRAYGFDKFARKTMNALYRTVPGKVKQRKFKRV